MYMKQVLKAVGLVPYYSPLVAKTILTLTMEMETVTAMLPHPLNKKQLLSLRIAKTTAMQVIAWIF